MADASTSFFPGQVVLGNRECMSLNGVATPEQIEQQIQSFEEHGQTVVLAAVDGKKVIFVGD